MSKSFKKNKKNYKSSFKEDFWYDKFNKNNIGFRYMKPTYETPTEGENNTHYNCVLFSQKMLDDIQAKCLPVAGGSEFQFHYRALQIKIEDVEANKVLVFTIPTVFFNFPQKVSSASVDFNLEEVKVISEKVKTISNQLAKKFASWFPKSYFEQQGFKVRFIEGEIGSIHRHPGRFGFSSTDLRNNPLSPGVIFRVSEAQDLHQVDSVLYCGLNAELYTTETRLFNTALVDPQDEDKGATGTVEECPTVTYIHQDEENVVPSFKSFFGEKDSSKENPSFKISRFKTDEIFDEVEAIFALYIQKGYEAIEVIEESLIEERFNRYHYNYNYNYNQQSSYLGLKKNNKDENLYQIEDSDVEEFEEDYMYLDDPQNHALSA
jgi:hypothetical protein